jgi:hypothetical protein
VSVGGAMTDAASYRRTRCDIVMLAGLYLACASSGYAVKQDSGTA